MFKRILTKIFRNPFKKDYSKLPIEVGCYVRWNQRALNDPIFWCATSKNKVKVERIEIPNVGDIFYPQCTIHFKTPIDYTFNEPIYSAFSCWLERC